MLYCVAVLLDLELKRHGLKFLFRNPSSFTPMLDGRYLMMGPDAQFNQDQIAKFSKRDAQRYAEYDEHLTRLTSFFEPYLDAPPPGPSMSWAERMDQFRTAGKLVRNAARLGREVLDFHEILTAPASRILDRWFESEPLKSTLATDAVIGAMTSPSTPGSGYVLFHHVMGEVEGTKGAWTYVQGGMGAVSQAIASAAREAGASVHTNARVERILVENERACGVVLADGRVLRSRVVLSNATPNVTFTKLLSSSDVPPSVRQDVEHLDHTSPVCKINISMDRLPNFKACPHEGNEAGPQHRGTIHFVETTSQIETAYRDAQAGRPSRRPVIEMTIPSVLDNTLAPPGKHVASLFVQYAP
jgi:phytoene dehydrogenase-like protein